MPVRHDLFVYASHAPLDLTVEAELTEGPAAVANVSYDGGQGRRVNALIAKPRQADASRRGVVIAHGGFEGGKHLFRDHAIEMAAAGFVAIVADTTFPSAGDRDKVEEARRSSVVTHMRSLDVLSRHHGITSFGFFGHSRGALEGAVLAAVEPRLSAVVLAGIGSASARRREQASQDASTADYYAAVFSLDAADYVAEQAARRLLVQHGHTDTAVTLAEARAMFEAAAPPKEWREYDCGHDVATHPPARAERILFFSEALD